MNNKPLTTENTEFTEKAECKKQLRFSLCSLCPLWFKLFFGSQR